MIVHVRFIDLPLRPNFARPIRIHAVTGGLSEVLAAGLTSRCVYSLPVYARTCRIVLSGEAGPFKLVDRRQTGSDSITSELLVNHCQPRIGSDRLGVPAR